MCILVAFWYVVVIHNSESSNRFDNLYKSGTRRSEKRKLTPNFRPRDLVSLVEHTTKYRTGMLRGDAIPSCGVRRRITLGGDRYYIVHGTKKLARIRFVLA